MIPVPGTRSETALANRVDGTGGMSSADRDLFEIVDHNEDGFVSPAEFERFRAGYCDREDPTRGSLFSLIDQNNDGIITTEEFRQFFGAADLDGEGFISRSKFAHYEQVVAPIVTPMTGRSSSGECVHMRSLREHAGAVGESEVLDLIEGILEGFRTAVATGSSAAPRKQASMTEVFREAGTGSTGESALGRRPSFGLVSLQDSFASASSNEVLGRGSFGGGAAAKSSNGNWPARGQSPDELDAIVLEPQQQGARAEDITVQRQAPQHQGSTQHHDFSGSLRMDSE